MIIKVACLDPFANGGPSNRPRRCANDHSTHGHRYTIDGIRPISRAEGPPRLPHPIQGVVYRRSLIQRTSQKRRSFRIVLREISQPITPAPATQMPAETGFEFPSACSTSVLVAIVT